MSTLNLPFEVAGGPAFEFHEIVRGHGISVGRLPDAFVPDERGFEELWNLHPKEYSLLLMHGRLVPAPRWNQAFSHAYTYSGFSHPARPIVPPLDSFLKWGRSAIDERLNGVGANWYDATMGHYIGPHRDHRDGLVVGAPLVTIAFGEERPFRVRPWKGRGYMDFASPHGTVFIISYASNLAITHEVPLFARHRGRRISVTMRAFA